MTIALAAIAFLACLAAMIAVWIGYFQWRTARLLAHVVARSSVMIAAQSKALGLATRALVDLEEIASRWEPDAAAILAEDFNEQLDRLMETTEDRLGD